MDDTMVGTLARLAEGTGLKVEPITEPTLGAYRLLRSGKQIFYGTCNEVGAFIDGYKQGRQK